MLQLGLPHLNVLTKCDLVTADTLEKYVNNRMIYVNLLSKLLIWLISCRFRFPDGDALLHRLNQKDSRRAFTLFFLLLDSMYTRLNEALSELVGVNLLKFDILR